MTYYALMYSEKSEYQYAYNQRDCKDHKQGRARNRFTYKGTQPDINDQGNDRRYQCI